MFKTIHDNVVEIFKEITLEVLCCLDIKVIILCFATSVCYIIYVVTDNALIKFSLCAKKSLPRNNIHL